MLQHALPQDHVCIDFVPDGAPEEGYAIQVSASGRYSVAYDVHEDLGDLVTMDKTTGLITCDTMPFMPDFEELEDEEREERADRDSFLIRIVPCPTGSPHIHVRSVNHPDGDESFFLKNVHPQQQIRVLTIGSRQDLERILATLLGS